MTAAKRPRGDPADNGHLPPTDDAAEASLLGAALLDSDAAAIVATDVRVDAFNKPAHGHIAAAIRGLFAEGVRKPDPVVVADRLRRDGLLDLSGGSQYLNQLTSVDVPAVSNAPRYADIVSRNGMLRRLIHTGPDIARIGYTSTDPAEAMTRARQLLDNVDPVASNGTNIVGHDGARFLLDDEVELAPRWGRRSDVLWAFGEPCMIAGPTGVGKTTITGQLVAALIGATDNVLGYPVQPCRLVLYLAMDRPRQIRRALRRYFGEEHRDLLAQRLIIRPGPLTTDLVKSPTQLVDLARQHNADVVIVDSLKDAASKLTDDETGGQVNRALQLCNVADIDVLVLHHQRKSQQGNKPTKLDDVYGSTWITAGCGSVILLWGEAGSELVELSHLKQPADLVGPFDVEHDHHRGTSRIVRGFDVVQFLRQRSATGVTVAEAAQAEHGSPQKPGCAKWKRTERRLRRLARDGFAVVPATQGRGDGGLFGEVRYFIAAPDLTVDIDHGQGV